MNRITYDDGAGPDSEKPMLDEVVYVGNVRAVHVERMDSNSIWIGIDLDDGTQTHVNLWTPRAIIFGRAESDSVLRDAIAPARAERKVGA